MCPPPGHHGVGALLYPTGSFSPGDPDRFENLGNVTRLNLVQALLTELREALPVAALV